MPIKKLDFKDLISMPVLNIIQLKFPVQASLMKCQCDNEKNYKF